MNEKSNFNLMRQGASANPIGTTAGVGCPPFPTVEPLVRSNFWEGRVLNDKHEMAGFMTLYNIGIREAEKISYCKILKKEVQFFNKKKQAIVIMAKSASFI